MVYLEEMALLNDNDFQNVLRSLLFLRDPSAGPPLGAGLTAGTSRAAGHVPPGTRGLGETSSVDVLGFPGPVQVSWPSEEQDPMTGS